MMKTQSSQKKLISFLFIMSLVSLMICFFFLEFGYATRNGGKNGFHVFDTTYSVFYGFSHVSYLSCLFVTVGSGFEGLGLYKPKFRPKFIFRFFALFGITLTMCGESLLLPSMMAPRLNVIKGIFNFSNGTSLNGGFARGGFFYSLLDFSQFMAIHIAIPITAIAYSIQYKQKELTKKEKGIALGMISGFMLGGYFYCGIFTLLGMEGPYPIIDGTPDGINDGTIVNQVISSLLGLITFSLVTYYTLNYLEVKGNTESERTIDEVYFNFTEIEKLQSKK